MYETAAKRFLISLFWLKSNTPFGCSILKSRNSDCYRCARKPEKNLVVLVGSTEWWEIHFGTGILKLPFYEGTRTSNDEWKQNSFSKKLELHPTTHMQRPIYSSHYSNLLYSTAFALAAFHTDNKLIFFLQYNSSFYSRWDRPCQQKFPIQKYLISFLKKNRRKHTVPLKVSNILKESCTYNKSEKDNAFYLL